MHKAEAPKLQFIEKGKVVVSGCWRVEALSPQPVFSAIRSTIKKLPSGKSEIAWDLSQITELDYIGAQFLWDVWGHAMPASLNLLPEHRTLFERIEKTGQLDGASTHGSSLHLSTLIKRVRDAVSGHFIDFVTLSGQFILDCARLARAPGRGPWKEISANVYHGGTRAVGIIALVGFLIGVVLSYLSAQQLHNFGGDPYLVNLLGIGITRELGPMLAAILVAGRSGSSMTAQIGVMRVTEELNAMQVMGMSHGFRLVLPKVLALAIVMPLLIMWTNIIALLGGMLAARMSIGLSMDYFISALPEAVPIANLWIGVGKGVIFGILIALVSCHFGLRIKPNTESLGSGTTSAVVTAITVVILADAVLAILLQRVGFS